MAIDPVSISRPGYVNPVESAGLSPKEVAEKPNASKPNQPENDRQSSDLLAPGRPKNIREALDKLNSVMEAMDVQMKLSIHEATNRTMVKVVNAETGQVIREIPPHRTLDMLAKMQELVGLLLDEHA